MIKKYYQIIDPVQELFAHDMPADRVADDAPMDHYSRVKMYHF